MTAEASWFGALKAHQHHNHSGILAQQDHLSLLLTASNDQVKAALAALISSIPMALDSGPTTVPPWRRGPQPRIVLHPVREALCSELLAHV